MKPPPYGHKNPETKREKPVVFPCSGNSYLGILTSQACLELAKSGEVNQVEAPFIPDLNMIRQLLTGNNHCVIVDGCQQTCMKHQLQELHMKIDLHLVLSDLGLENRMDSPKHPEDIELAKDAIIATSSGPPNIIPMIPGCSCSQ